MSQGCLQRLCLPVVFATIASLSPLEARLGNAAEDLTNDTFDAFVEKNRNALVDFYDKGDENWASLQAELDNAVRQVRSLGKKVPVGKVNVVVETALAKRFVPAGRLPQLLWFLHGHPTKYHRSLRTMKSIADFVLALDRDPLVIVKNDEEARGYNRAIITHTTKDSPLFKMMEVVASKFLDTVAFAVRDSPEDHNVTYVSDDASPVKYEGEVTVNALESWVRGLLIKSEAPPEGEPEEGEAVVVVGKTFEKLVIREDKDVLILIYAPWCGHSRKVAPAWEALARAVTRESHLVVAKIDGDRNSSPLPDIFNWDAYPTIMFFKAGNRTPAIFHGNRTVTNFVKFVNDHGSAPFSVDEEILKELDEDSIAEL